LAATAEVVAFAHGGHNGAGRGWANAGKLHQLLGLFIFFGDLFDVLVTPHTQNF